MIASTTEHLPLGLDKIICDCKNTGLITPSQLFLGKSNDRSAAVAMEVLAILIKIWKEITGLPIRALKSVGISFTKTDESCKMVSYISWHKS